MGTIKVLYAEDEADIRELTQYALEDEGFELIAFSTGIEAVKQAENIVPDLILLDMMMPGIDGITTARQLREFPHLQNVPIIFMTAKVQTSEKEKYLAVGAAGVICKPFDAMRLADEIRSILANEGIKQMPPQLPVE